MYVYIVMGGIAVLLGMRLLMDMLQEGIVRSVKDLRNMKKIIITWNKKYLKLDLGKRTYNLLEILDVLQTTIKKVVLMIIKIK